MVYIFVKGSWKHFYGIYRGVQVQPYCEYLHFILVHLLFYFPKSVDGRLSNFLIPFFNDVHASLLSTEFLVFLQSLLTSLYLASQTNGKI